MASSKKPKVEWSDLERLRHSIVTAQIRCHRVEMELRDWHKMRNTPVGDEIVRNTIDALVEYNSKELGRLMDEVNEIILKK